MRIAMMLSLMLIVGVAAALGSERKPLRTAALSGASAVLIGLIFSAYIYPYEHFFDVESMVGNVIVAGLGAIISLCGGLVACRVWPNKAMEPTR